MAITIREAVQAILAAMPDSPISDTVDVFKTGDPDQKLTGVVTTFLASQKVIEQAIQLGANLIITHEPTFYNHPDQTVRLANNATYLAKRKLIDDHNIVVWRFHDYLHTLRPDPTAIGLLGELGWEAYADNDALPQMPTICRIPATDLRGLIAEVKERLALDRVLVVGRLDMTCRNVGLLVGAPGGEWQISVLDREDVDVLLAGEINEWESSEYTRDAVAQGRNKALVVLGHAASEEAGMRWLVPWLQTCLPDTTINFVAAGSPLKWA